MIEPLMPASALFAPLFELVTVMMVPVLVLLAILWSLESWWRVEAAGNWLRELPGRFWGDQWREYRMSPGRMAGLPDPVFQALVQEARDGVLPGWAHRRVRNAQIQRVRHQRLERAWNKAADLPRQGGA